MHLDVRTVFLVTAFSALTLGLSLWLTSRSYTAPPKGTKIWALACCGIGIGWTLSASRGHIPDAFAIILSNGLVLLSVIAFYQAIRELKDKSFNEIPYYAVLTVIIGLLIYFNYFLPSIWIRSILVTGYGSMIGLICVRELLFVDRYNSFFSHKLTGLFFLFCSIVGMSRIFYLVFIDSTIQNIFEQNLMQDFHVSSLFIGVVILTFGFMLMINDKINLELTRATDEVKTLSALLPICSYCKNIRDDQNNWQTVESYVTQHTDSKFSHTFCPSCYEEKVLPELNKFKTGKINR